MKIYFDIRKNFKCYLNQGLELTRLALESQDESQYKYGCLFSAIAIELGFALVARDGMKLDIYKDKKRERTKSFYEIKILMKSELSSYSKNLFPSFKHVVDTEDITVEPMIDSINIRPEVLDKEIKNISKLRNSLIHYQGVIDTETHINDIVVNLLYLNMILPNSQQYSEIVESDENIEFFLRKCFDKAVLSRVSKDLSLSEMPDEYYQFSEIEGICECEQCGQNSLCKIDVKVNMSGFLCLFCMDHGYMVECIQCSEIIFPWKATKWDDKGISHICEDCSDNFAK